MNQVATQPTLTSEALSKAMFGDPKMGLGGVEDLMTRCALGESYLVLGETARAMQDDLLLSGDCLEIGIRLNQITPEVVSTIKTFTGVENPRESFTYIEGQVPVKVKVITRNYTWFQNPNKKIYQYAVVNLPNPFEKYYKARFIVR